MINKSNRKSDVKRNAQEYLIEALRSKCSRVLKRSTRNIEHESQLMII